MSEVVEAAPAPRRLPGLRALALAPMVLLAFAAPAIFVLARGHMVIGESQLGRVVVRAFGGISLPVLASVIAALTLSRDAIVRRRADLRVAAGEEPTRALARPLTHALVCIVASALLGSLVVVAALRVHLHLGSAREIVLDVLGTTWAVSLGGVAWLALAAALVVRSGRGVTAFLLIPLDLVSRLLPGAAQWFVPSSHVANLLGAPPPEGFVHVPVLPQLASVGALVVFAALGLAITARRYRGVP